MAGNEGGTTKTFTYECPYRGVCSENSLKCETCKHSPKRSYYEPVEPPGLPQYPVELYDPYTFYLTTHDSSISAGSYSDTEK